MSSLTDEQKKRIEENRARALAKLAEKKSLTRPHNQNISVSIPSRHSTVKQTAFYNKPSTSRNEASHNNNSTTQNLSRFKYHRGASKQDSSYKAVNKTSSNNKLKNSHQTDSKNENVNDALMKPQVVTASCVLIDKTRFKVIAPFHTKLIGILKSIPSKCYGRLSHAEFLIQTLKA